MVKNGNMRFSTVRVHIGRSPNQEWQYDISTVRAYIGRSPGRYILPFLLLELLFGRSNCQIYIVTSTVRAHIGRSTGRYISPFLLLELIVADEVADLPSPVELSSGQE